jgi:hypothetical protein
MGAYLDQFTDLPRLTPQAVAWRRQESNARLAGTPDAMTTDEAAATIPEEDPSRPARIGNQFFELPCDYGENDPSKLPFVASRRLNNGRLYEDIRTVYVVYHGELRNAHDYYHNFIRHSLRKDFDEQGVLVIAPQAPAAIDPIDDSTLRWGINGARGGEPAEAPSPPYSYFEAMDYFLDLIYELCPNMRELCEIGNSEGGQVVDRRLAWGRSELRLEEHGVRVRGRSQNPGTVQRWHPVRLSASSRPQHYRWEGIPSDDPANRWPHSLYDPTAEDFDIFGPSPYVRDFLLNYHPRIALENSLRRTIWTVGEYDNNAAGSRVPVGPGPNAMGDTRRGRIEAKREYLRKFVYPYLGRSATSYVFVVRGIGHSAQESFARTFQIRGCPDHMWYGRSPMDGDWWDPDPR